MYSKKSYVTYFMVSVAAFLVFSISFLLMPIETNVLKPGPNAYMIVAGILFWGGLITGIVFQILLSVNIKKWCLKNKAKLPPRKDRPKLGLISFLKNKTAIIFDVLLAVSVIGLVISMVMTNAVGYICYVFIALLSFSFCAHCIFNGKNYYYIKNKNKIEKSVGKSESKAIDMNKEKKYAER